MLSKYSDCIMLRFTFCEIIIKQKSKAVIQIVLYVNKRHSVKINKQLR